MNPIQKAHLEGVEMFKEKFDFAIRCNTGVADEVLAFLTTYAESILNAALEAGPGEVALDDEYTEEEKKLLLQVAPDYKTPEYLRERRHGYNQACTSFISAINEGIKLIKD